MNLLASFVTQLWHRRRMVFYILLEIERTLLGMLSQLRIRTKIGNFEIKKKWRQGRCGWSVWWLFCKTRNGYNVHLCAKSFWRPKILQSAVFSAGSPLWNLELRDSWFGWAVATLGEFRVDQWSMTIRLLLLSYVLTLISSSTFLLSGNDLSEQKKKIDPWKDLTCNSVLFCHQSFYFVITLCRRSVQGEILNAPRRDNARKDTKYTITWCFTHCPWTYFWITSHPNRERGGDSCSENSWDF